MSRRVHSRSPILRGHSRSPIRNIHSRSPIRDAISLVVDSDSDSDDDDDEERDDVVRLPNFPPDLASTYSSSTEGGGAKSKGGGGGGNDHAIDDDDNDVGGQAAPPPPQAVGVDMSSINKDKAPLQKPLDDHNHRSNSGSGSGSGIGKWRRTNLHIATTERSPFSPASSNTYTNNNQNHQQQQRVSNNSHQHQNPNNNNNNGDHPSSHYYNSCNSIPITPLHQIPYVHGGYAGAAPLFVNDSKFASILKKLLPSAYEELSCLLRKDNTNGKNYTRGNSRSSSDASGRGGKVDRMATCSPRYSEVASTSNDDAVDDDGINGNGNSAAAAVVEVILPDPVKVMKWAENNPVVSAFGIWNSDSGRRTIKFMQGINLCNTNNLDNSDGIFNDWNDRESVVTIGSNGNYHGGGGAGNGGGGRNGQFQRARRRKQPLPDDVGSTADPSGACTGVGIEATVLGGVHASSQLLSRPNYQKPALEWDIFLDPNLVRQVDAAMCVVDTLELKLRKARVKRQMRLMAAGAAAKKLKKQQQKQKRKRKLYNTNTNDDDDSSDSDNDEHEIEDNDDFDILQSHTAAQVEVDRLVSQLMRRTIIAHGSMSQLVLEAMGVAPKYNFGTVVKSSREGGGAGASASAMGGGVYNASPSRSMKRVSLRAGNTEFSLNMTRTNSWDEEEEVRDFEALLDPSIMVDGGTAGKQSERGGLGSRRRRVRTAPTSTSASGSKGMFMETWIHVFAQTLSLLVKSSNSGNGGNAISKKSSSSSNSRNSRRDESTGLLTTKDRPARIGQRGLSGLLEKMFLRRDSSFPNDATKVNGGNLDDTIDQENEAVNNNNMLDYDDDNSELLTPNDMFSPQTPTTSYSSAFGSMCGMSLCLGISDGTDSGETSSFPSNPHASHKMAQDIERISSVLGEPLRLVLDLKSRRVPPRVWSRLIDSLRTRGLVIEGIGSFDMDELRVIGKGCSYPLTPLLFFHSVGDLQRACHANEVKNGDTVYFNGGSLMWKRSSIMEAAERGCCGAIDTSDYDVGSDGGLKSPRAGSGGGGGGGMGGNYSFQPYAYPRSALSDWERVMCKSTIEDYRRHFNLKVGVYVQEFSISAEALDALSIFVNKHGGIYDQGLAFGGVNGNAVKNIHGDGYWNQRYMGRSWDFLARPSKEMTPLKPEDHHLVQKAIQAGAWGQVGTIYEVMDEKAGALTVLPPPREPCNMVNTF